VNKSPIGTLFQKYLNNLINSEELRELLRYFEHSDTGDDLTPLIRQELDRVEAHPDELSLRIIADRAERRIVARTEPMTASLSQSRWWTNRRWIQVAAALLVMLTGTTYFYLKSTDRLQVPISRLADIAPGSNQAKLTLPDGRVIDLSTAQNGIIVGNGIRYVDGSGLIDNGPATMNNDSASKRLPSAIGYQLSTPKGGTYQVTLPDGSKVWLNAASTLQYPAQFNGETREVELEGEGYFEVAKNERQPFFVKSRGQLVKVVGTAFNINAYADEVQVTTTLVEGAIAIGDRNTSTRSSEGFDTLLLPGQQASFEDGRISITTVDANDFVGWKEGRFVFYGESMPLVMRQMERWYNVSFETKDLTAGIELWGSLSRDVMLSQILEVIELNTPLTFKREGRRIFISKE